MEPVQDLSAYLRFSPEVEVVQPHEADDVAALREIFTEMRDFAFEKHRHELRDAHAKSHGVLRATLRVHDDLPAELRQGLFSEPGERPVIIRFSTAPGDIVSDGIGAARGMALKVLDVDGEKALPDGARNQDFLLVDHPTISSGDVHTYRRDQALLLKAANAPEPVQLSRRPGGQGRRFKSCQPDRTTAGQGPLSRSWSAVPDPIDDV